MKRRYPDTPIVGVSALVIHKDKVLLIRRGKEPDKGRWSIPGGVIETGETIENALKRPCSHILYQRFQPGVFKNIAAQYIDPGQPRGLCLI